MSSRLAKQSLSFILKSSKSGSSDAAKRKGTAESQKPLRLPDTKNGIKKIKREMRYGRQLKAKERREKELKKENPLDALVRDERAIQDNLDYNVRLMLASRLKASDIEKKLRTEVIKQASKEAK